MGNGKTEGYIDSTAVDSITSAVVNFMESFTLPDGRHVPCDDALGYPVVVRCKPEHVLTPASQISSSHSLPIPSLREHTPR